MTSVKSAIEIIGISKECNYSIAKIHISKLGDVYLIPKGGIGLHYSRHRDGTCHWRTKQGQLNYSLPKQIPIDRFDGLESLGTYAFTADSMRKPKLEYKFRKCNAIVGINIDILGDYTFNLSFAILSKKNVCQFINICKTLENRHIYICADTHPMIGIVFGGVKGKSSKTSSQ